MTGEEGFELVKESLEWLAEEYQELGVTPYALNQLMLHWIAQDLAKQTGTLNAATILSEITVSILKRGPLIERDGARLN